MSIFAAFRAYHAVLVVFCVLAYLTGEAGRIHDWLGYGVAAAIGFRLLWSPFGPSHLGISRIFPGLGELRAVRWIDNPAIGKFFLSGLVLSLLVATGTGLAMDREFRGLFAGASPAIADDEGGNARERKGERAREGEYGVLGGLHEFSANLVFLFVAGHASFVLLFRRPLARYMLFLAPAPARPKRRKDA